MKTAFPAINEVVAIDGKTVRRSFDSNDRKSAIHMVNAWEGADYILVVKGNQPELNNQVKELFHLWPEELNKETFSEVDGEHGRIEKHRYRRIEINRERLPESVRRAGLKSVVELVVRERDTNGRTNSETRYFISSLPLDVRLAGSSTRYHWSVENCLHWVLDVAYREDECRIRRGHGAEVMAALRRLTLNILKKDTTKKAGIQRKRKIAALNKNYFLQLMGRFAAI